MTALDTKYDSASAEGKWYQYWLRHGFFASKPNPAKTPYTVVIPPPNVTGVLHMGHMLNNTIQDVLIRRARMQGKEALWVPGTDHASIATEAKVVKMLREQGIEKRDLSREQFLEHAWAWKEKYGGIILQQLQRLGASCDWSRTRFTMEPALSEQVIQTFVQWFRKGYIYRDYRMGNWDPAGQTALADDEVIHQDVQAQLYYVKYPLAGRPGEFVTIATTRPETIMADTAICVNPDDERFRHLIGAKAVVPLVHREIPIIADGYVDMAFGTGCLKVTPAHDPNDYEIGKRHGLEIIDILTPTGLLNEKAQVFVGEDRAKARKLVAKALEAEGLLAKTEQITHSVGFSERTNAVVEPRLSMQWYVRMEELCKPALEHVMNDNIRFHPAKFKNTYRHWMENVRDWCISRQLWWGHRIPAWYLPDGSFVVAEHEEEALRLAQERQPGTRPEDLQQDPDVLDTWFSSAAWPFSVFEGLNKPGNEDISYYYPTSTLVTGPDILFFWVARMIIYGYDFMGEKPFQDVYLTGIIRDKLGRKMSKSLGNSPDALELIDTYGADGVRAGMLFSSPAGNDLLFDERLCEQGRNFSNKVWNAFRLVKGWSVDAQAPAEHGTAIAWFEAKMQAVTAEVADAFDKYRISEALMAIYKLIWDDFCSLYLEIVKPPFGQPIDSSTYEATIGFFERLMRLLHPLMPFISEEVWQHIAPRQDGESICVAAYPESGPYDAALLDEAAVAFELVSQVRNTRNEKKLSPKVAFLLHINTPQPALFERFAGIIAKLANVEGMHFSPQKPDGPCTTLVVKTHEISIPLSGQVDVAEERANLEKELARMQGFLQGVAKKLENERFVKGAPEEAVARERQKMADAASKIKLLEEALASL